MQDERQPLGGLQHLEHDDECESDGIGEHHGRLGVEFARRDDRFRHLCVGLVTRTSGGFSNSAIAVRPAEPNVCPMRGSEPRRMATVRTFV